MKKLEKWLARPLVQRLVYLLLLLLCLYISSTNGMLERVKQAPGEAVSLSLAVYLAALALLGAQLVWNRLWGWRFVCAAMIGFTLWLATLRLPTIIAGAGRSAGTVVWAIGVVGFTALLVLALAFTNWVVLHIKPKKG